jgi:glutathione S-transferase
MSAVRPAPAGGFVVHGIPGSPYLRAVLVALHEKDRPFRLAAIAPGMRNTPAYLALQPFGKIPAFEHGAFRLYETQAILRYLDRVIPQPALTPTDPQAAARMDQLMNINDWYLFNGVANIIGFQRVVGPRLMGITTDENAIAACMPKATAVFEELARLLGDKAFFCGDSPSLADVILAPQLDFLVMTPEWQPLTAGNANLRAWLDRMNSRPSMARTTWEAVAALARAA